MFRNRNRIGLALLGLLAASGLALSPARAQQYPGPGGNPPGPGTPSGPGSTPGGSGGDATAGKSAGPDLDVFLTAAGVPNDGGKLRWPTALRVPGQQEVDDLRRRVESLFQVEAAQARAGRVNPRLTEELTRVVRDLRGRLRAEHERMPMPPASYEEAVRFLDRLEKAASLMENALAIPAGSKPSILRTVPESGGAPPTPAPGSVQVELRENAFEPHSVTVPAGATVEWANRGRHGHTVTSDARLWDSGEMAPGAVYSRSFPRPGSYPYHCGLHPTEMRGVVVVK
jgi:plastocyanin